MTPYPNRCPSCKSASRNVGGSVICSNVRCKTWHQWRKPVPSIEHIEVVEGDTPENPIIIICQNCGEFGWYLALGNVHHLYGNYAKQALCSRCHKWSSYSYKAGKWYKVYHIAESVEHFIGGDKYGGWEEQPLSAWKSGFNAG